MKTRIPAPFLALALSRSGFAMGLLSNHACIRALFAAWLVLLLSSSASAGVPAGWSTNYPSALAKAKRDQQPVLVYFTATWCGPCREMARTTLPDPAVAEVLTNLNRVALDIDEFQALSRQRGVRAVPTFQMLSPGGDEVDTLVGYQAPGAFVSWLTNGLSKAKVATVRQKQSEQKLASAEKSLQENSARAQPGTVAELLDLYADDSSSVRESAGAQLTALAKNQPALLLPGLEHPRLAVRICAANLLRDRFGDAFNIDPWSDPASRRQTIAQWREKLKAEAQ